MFLNINTLVKIPIYAPIFSVLSLKLIPSYIGHLKEYKVTSFSVWFSE